MTTGLSMFETCETKSVRRIIRPDSKKLSFFIALMIGEIHSILLIGA